MTVEDLKKIWEPAAHKVTTCKECAPNGHNSPLKLYGAVLIPVLLIISQKQWSVRQKPSRGDYTASEDDNTLVQGIAGDKAALGYLPFDYPDNAKKPMAIAIEGGPKAPLKTAVMPSDMAVEDGTYFPLSGLFIYVSAKSAERPEAERVCRVSSNATLAKQVKYVALPPPMRTASPRSTSPKSFGSAPPSAVSSRSASKS